MRVLQGCRAPFQAGEQRSVITRSRLATYLIMGVLALCAVAPAASAGEKAHRKEGRTETRARTTKSENRSSSKTHAAGTEARKSRGKHNKKPRFVKLTSLVATVDGVSVAPDDAPEVKGTRFHRPADTTTREAQAAGATTTAPTTGGGMLNFLIAALLLACLAAWLVRQMGALRE